MTKKQKNDQESQTEKEATQEEENKTSAEEVAQGSADKQESAKPEASIEEQLATTKDQLLRALAELDNTRRRAEREKIDASKYAISTFARDVLSVSDNFRRALSTVPADSPVRQDKTIDALITGVEMTEKELLNTLDRHGVKEITPQVGEKFDPHRHQAVFELPDSPHPPGSVVQVIQAGYVIGDRLLRPAMVGVAKAGGGPGKVDTKV